MAIKFTTNQINDIIYKFKAGMYASEIGLQNNCSKNTIKRLLKRNGVNKQSHEYIKIGTVKICTKCKIIKPKSEFFKRSQSKTKLLCECKDCWHLHKSTMKKIIPQNKTCSKCKNTKTINEFSKCSASKDMHGSACKQCLSQKVHYIIPIEKICNKCKETKIISQFPINHKSIDKHSQTCRKCSRQIYNKIYTKKHAKKLKQNREEYVKKNKDKIKMYLNKNKHKQREYNRNKYKTDINHCISHKLRIRIKKALKRNSKSASSSTLLGCSIEYLKEHLQQTAIQNGYTDFNINNYSGKEYHIDHIKPCASFDLSKPEEQEQCFHYSNLQILTARENLIKSNN